MEKSYTKIQYVLMVGDLYVESFSTIKLGLSKDESFARKYLHDDKWGYSLEDIFAERNEVKKYHGVDVVLKRITTTTNVTEKFVY